MAVDVFIELPPKFVSALEREGGFSPKTNPNPENLQIEEMGRRRLRLAHSSDEENDRTSQVTSPNLAPPPPAPPPSNAPFEISDDDDVDFVEASDAFSPPAPDQPPENTQPDEDMPPVEESVGEAEEGPGSEVAGLLCGLGLRLRREWLESCIVELASSRPGFERMDAAGKAKLFFKKFLISDMNFCGGGVLPENVQSMHNVVLEGPFVLQVDEIVNISSPLRERYENTPAGHKRCLKLLLTDGAQCVFGMEYRSIRELEVLAPAGLKVAICNVLIRRGLLMLVPEVLKVLGGVVENLEQARERLVQEVKKPPRGKRTRQVLPLSERASRAAWLSDNANSSEQVIVSTPHGIPQQNPQDTLPIPGVGAGGAFVEDFSDIYTGETMVEETSPIRNTSQGFYAPYTSRRTTGDFAASSTRGTNTVELSIPHTGSTLENLSLPNTERSSTDNFSATSPVRGTTADFAAPIEEPHVSFPRINVLEEPASGSIRQDTEPTASSRAIYDAEDIHRVDIVEKRSILTGDNEIPFTYMSCLLAKWEAREDNTQFIQGHIKFVQKVIGHSPKAVTAALSSSDKKTVSDMRETMKKFQKFLVNFEGIMLVEVNEKPSLPVALELSQGCPASDAWLLLGRLKQLTAPTMKYCLPSPINLSP